MKITDLFNVSGKVAVVTGGSRGIGEMIAAGLLANGVKVYITARKEAALMLKAKELSETFQAECLPVPCDLSTMEGMEEFSSYLQSQEESIDFLINNAGASWGEPYAEYSEKGWDKVMDTNVKGVFFLTQKLLPLLRSSATAEDPSRVINIGSIDGIKTGLFDAFSYGPSKAALHHLTRVLAASLVKENIIVNAIAPGPFPTWMLSTGVGGGGDLDINWDEVGNSNPRGRVGTPEDIAGLAIFLCSRAGAYTVGETITCDGGAVASS